MSFLILRDKLPPRRTLPAPLRHMRPTPPNHCSSVYFPHVDMPEICYVISCETDAL